MLITQGDNSVRIAADSYANDRYIVQYGAGPNPVVLGSLKLGTNGDDKDDAALIGSGEADLLVGLDGADTIQGDGGDDTLFGGRHVDTLLGGAGNDKLYGGGYGDTLEGGEGSDQFDGGGGVDTITYASSSGGVDVNLETNAFSGGDAAGDSLLVLGSVENIIGSGEVDRLTGDAGDNKLSGGAGSDRLYGGEGNDILEGGAGTGDAYIFAGSYGADTIQGDDDGGVLRFINAAGIADFVFSRDANGDLLITQGGNSVRIVADSYANDRYILQYGSGNTPLGRLTAAEVTGETIDAILGDTKDIMVGSDGEDTLRGAGGEDNIFR